LVKYSYSSGILKCGSLYADVNGKQDIVTPVFILR
jgi:hypothetical protein